MGTRTHTRTHTEPHNLWVPEPLPEPLPIPTPSTYPFSRNSSYPDPILRHAPDHTVPSAIDHMSRYPIYHITSTAHLPVASGYSDIILSTDLQVLCRDAMDINLHIERTATGHPLIFHQHIECSHARFKSMYHHSSFVDLAGADRLEISIFLLNSLLTGPVMDSLSNSYSKLAFY